MATDLRPSTRGIQFASARGECEVGCGYRCREPLRPWTLIVRRTARGTRVECRKSWLTRRAARNGSAPGGRAAAGRIVRRLVIVEWPRRTPRL